MHTLAKDDKYKEMISSVAEYLEGKGYQHIKADALEEYDTPAPLVRKGSERSFTPDLTARIGGGKHYFELVNYEEEDKNRIISKWMLLSTLAEHRNGKFFLLVPHGKMKYTNRIIENHKIDAEVLSMKSIQPKN